MVNANLIFTIFFSGVCLAHAIVQRMSDTQEVQQQATKVASLLQKII